MSKRYFATCTLGVESVLAEEIAALGAWNIRAGRGGVSFEADRRIAYSACLRLRSATRVQQELARSPVRSEEDLYRFAKSGPWSRYITPRNTLSVDASLKDSSFTHSGFVAQRVKDAVADWFREKTGRRPSVDRKAADLPLKVLVEGDLAILYRDLAGESLHKRGYRPAQVKSPLNEAVAAGLLGLANWKGDAPLVDPMCGSGTFLIEGALIALRRAPGLGRSFAFERWSDFDAVLFERLKAEARAGERRDLPFTLEGADVHRGAIGVAAAAAKAAGVAPFIRFTHRAVDRFLPEAKPHTVVANPPYGVRLGEGGNPADAWRDLGRFLKERCSPSRAFILCGDKALSAHLKLKAKRRHPVYNGPIECRFLEYELLPPREDSRGGDPLTED